MSSDNGHPKRLGIISDIHSNLEALQAVLASIEVAGVDQIVCCGDVVGYGASPNECVALLRSREIPTVLGNHDAAVLNDDELVFFNELARDAILWTRQTLAPEHLQWLSELPRTLKLCDALFVHASPEEPAEWNYVLTYGEARHAFQWFEEQICFIGHSHQPFFIALHGDDLIHLRTEKIALEPFLRFIVNVGSVGQPRDRNPRAAFVIADFDERRLSLHRVEYDVATAQDKIRRLTNQYELAERLTHGH